MKKFRFLLFISVMILGYFLMFNTEKKNMEEIRLKPDSYMDGLRIVNKKGGRELWTLNARKAAFSDNETLARMDAVTVDFKKEGMVLSADSGIYNMNDKNLRLKNNITAVTDDFVIKTGSLDWKSASGELITNERVRIKGKRSSIEGNGLSATERQTIRLMNNVTAIFY